ncbi:MAG: hypothetical protein ACLVIZ_01005 [Bifidobacterium pseudocatenulatum]
MGIITKPRPQHLNKLVAAQDNNLIKVITGMRTLRKSSFSHSSDSIFCTGHVCDASTMSHDIGNTQDLSLNFEDRKSIGASTSFK